MKFLIQWVSMENTLKKIANPIILSCFFVSGLTALIYQVVWTRVLTLVFGNTTFAYSTILTVFMIGLALGSKYFGKLIDRKGYSPIKMYALLEGGIGIYALAFPLLIKLQDYLGFLYRPESNFYVSSLVLFALCFLLLILPTFLMGGTLPILTKYFVTNFSRRGGTISKIYALNTAGSVLGAFLSGYYLIIRLGVLGSISVASTLNLLIAFVCLLIYKKSEAVTGEPDVAVHEDMAKPEALDGRDKLLIGLFFVSGLTAMVYEVTWTRILSMVLGSSVYAFATMLTTFLLGLAVGSYLFSFVLKKKKVTIVYFAVIEISIGILCLFLLPLFNELTYWSYILHSVLANSYSILQLSRFFLCFMVMLAPALLFGATFPLVATLYSRSKERVGRDVGIVYFWNTLGSTFGSFLVGFLFIPLLGIRNSIVLAVLLNLAAGFVALFSRGFKIVKLAPVAIVLFILVFSQSFDLDRKMLTAGVYSNALGEKVHAREEFAESMKDSELIYYKEGLSAVVSLHKDAGALYLRVNGKTDASTDVRDMKTQVLVGHLPFLLNMREKYGKIAVVGVGSGITTAAAAMHPSDGIYSIEIEAAVIEAADLFKDYNHDVQNNPRVTTVIADGRHFIRNSNERFDVIISEPSNPWIAGIGNLFTDEFYRIVLERLNDGGMFAQWVQGYNMSPYLVKVILNTFVSVFPSTSLWQTNKGDYLLLGQKSGDPDHPLRLDYVKVKEYLKRVPGVAADFKRIGISDPAILSKFFLMQGSRLRTFCREAERNTDEFPILEFRAPMHLLEKTTDSNYRGFQSLKTGEDVLLNVPINDHALMARNYVEMARIYLQEGNMQAAVANGRKAIEREPETIEWYHFLTNLYMRENSYLEAQATLLQALQIKNGNNTHNILGILYSRQGRKNEAINHFQKALELESADRFALRNLASLYQDIDKPEESLGYLKRLASITGGNPDILQKMSSAYRMRKMYPESIGILAKLQESNPSAGILRLIGDDLMQAGKYNEALIYLSKAFKLEPNDPQAQLSLGICHFHIQNYELAFRLLSEVLTKNSFNGEALKYKDRILAGNFLSN